MGSGVGHGFASQICIDTLIIGTCRAPKTHGAGVSAKCISGDLRCGGVSRRRRSTVSVAELVRDQLHEAELLAVREHSNLPGV